MFVVSAQQVVDGTHYEPQCKVVQAMMTPTASPTLTPAPSVTPARRRALTQTTARYPSTLSSAKLPPDYDNHDAIRRLYGKVRVCLLDDDEARERHVLRGGGGRRSCRWGRRGFNRPDCAVRGECVSSPNYPSRYGYWESCIITPRTGGFSASSPSILRPGFARSRHGSGRFGGRRGSRSTRRRASRGRPTILEQVRGGKCASCRRRPRRRLRRLRRRRARADVLADTWRPLRVRLRQLDVRRRLHDEPQLDAQVGRTTGNAGTPDHAATTRAARATTCTSTRLARLACSNFRTWARSRSRRRPSMSAWARCASTITCTATTAGTLWVLRRRPHGHAAARGEHGRRELDDDLDQVGQPGRQLAERRTNTSMFVRQVRLVGTTGSGSTSDMAIDDLVVFGRIDCDPDDSHAAPSTMPPTFVPTEQTPDTCMYSPDFESGSFRRGRTASSPRRSAAASKFAISMMRNTTISRMMMIRMNSGPSNLRQRCLRRLTFRRCSITQRRVLTGAPARRTCPPPRARGTSNGWHRGAGTKFPTSSQAQRIQIP